MRYLLMRTGGKRRDSHTIYLIPQSAHPDEFKVLFPATLKGRILEAVLYGGIRILKFRGCSEEAEVRIRKELENFLKKKLEKYRGGGRGLFAFGVVLGVIDVINLFFPDPLPLFDEVMLALASVGFAFWGYRLLKDTIPRMEREIIRAKDRVGSLDLQEDPVLTRIFEAIREKDALDGKGTAETVESAEKESRWLVDFVSVEDGVREGHYTSDDVRRIIAVLRDAFPLRRYLNLEARLPYTSRRLRRMRAELMDTYELSENALQVYAEVYKSARGYFKDRGEVFD